MRQKALNYQSSISIRHFDHIYNFGFLKVHAVIKGVTKWISEHKSWHLGMIFTRILSYDFNDTVLEIGAAHWVKLIKQELA